MKKLKENNIEDGSTETIIIQDKRPKGSKLKKKIIYVYDSESDEENAQKISSPHRERIPATGQRSSNNQSFLNANISGK